MISMRLYLFSIFFLMAIVCRAQIPVAGDHLPAWQKGYLDIHHINTGRGTAAFFILPDATTLLIDAGEMSPLDERLLTPRNAALKPDSSKKPYEWIAAYIKQVSPAPAIDYALITHFHDDHFGAWYPQAPFSRSGKYQLTGMTGLASILPVHYLIDRGFPDYNYPYDIKKLAAKYGGGEIEFDHTMRNYFSFLSEMRQQGMKMAALKAGSRQQLSLLNNAAAYPSFYIQNVKSNQWIWTGKDSNVIAHFPPVDTANRKTWPDENSLSLAIVLHYGPFSYYTGGDNPGNVFPGDNPLRDVETPVAKAVGEVDIAITDHHGNRDAVNEFMVKTLKPRVWIGQTWSSDHPGHEVLARMTNTNIYEGPRDLFATNMLDANRYVIGPLIDRSYKSQQGHILVRVLPGGNTYYVIILDDNNPVLTVKSVSGPYSSKINKNNHH
jgi:beta-lactamase superfamily II metal-dependent hydrolase